MFVSDIVARRMPNLDRKKFIKKYKRDFRWIQTKIIDLIIFRNEYCARSLNEVWSEKKERIPFITQSFQTYIDKQIDYDLIITSKMNRGTTIF